MFSRMAILPLLCCAVLLQADQANPSNLLIPGAQSAGQNEQQSGAVPQPLFKLVEMAPDSGQIVALYQAARTVSDVEAANDKVSNDIAKTQSVAVEVSRLYQSVATTCEGVDISQVQTIANKTKLLSDAVFMIDAQLTKSLLTLQKQTQSRKVSMAAWNSAEDVRRFELAVHKFGQLRVQTQEIAKTVDRFAASIRITSESCKPTTIPPLFARSGTPLSDQSNIRGQMPRELKQRPVNLVPRSQ